MYDSIVQISEEIGVPVYGLVTAFIWAIVWKGFALWKSARRNSKPWFIVLLVVNTLGILEILYIFLFSELNLDGKKQKAGKPKPLLVKPKPKGKR